MTNQKIGKLTVVKRDFSKQSKEAYWICQCECGNIKSIKGYNLRKGFIKDCGCTKNQNLIKDLTNQRFGSWTVLQRDFSVQKKGAYWICKCDCGNTKTVCGSELTCGRSKSCGYCKNTNQLIDLTGQQFGNWTVLYRDKNIVPVRWICQCSCGTIKSVRTDTLKNGQSLSCGCEKFSNGEKKIANILKENNIIFQTQKTFPNCKNKDLLKFDFYLPKYNILIEFDGEQHYRRTSYLGGIEKLRQQQQNDQIKNQWCKNNNIPLIRIPYYHLKEICLNDLFPDTSKYIVKISVVLPRFTEP